MEDMDMDTVGVKVEIRWTGDRWCAMATPAGRSWRTSLLLFSWQDTLTVLQRFWLDFYDGTRSVRWEIWPRSCKLFMVDMSLFYKHFSTEVQINQIILIILLKCVWTVAPNDSEHVFSTVQYWCITVHSIRHCTNKYLWHSATNVPQRACPEVDGPWVCLWLAGSVKSGLPIG